MNMFDRFRSVLKKKTPTAAELSEAAASAREAYEAAKAKAGEERLLHPKHLLAGATDAAKHKQLLADLDSDVQDASVFLAALEERHTEVAAAEAEAARVKLYEDARAQLAAASKSLETEYPELGRRFLALLHQVTSTDEAIRAANEDRPEGFGPLPSVEAAVRDSEDLPKKLIREEVVNCWCYESGLRIGEQREAEVVPQGGGRGYLPGGGGPFGHPAKVVVQKRFRRVTSHPSENARRSTRLYEMNFPSLRSGDQPVWTGESWTPSSAATAERLQAVEAGKGRRNVETDRPVHVEWFPTEVAVGSVAD